MRSIDLNSDLGEAYGPWTMGDDAAMLAIVSSANVACGGHAGDPETMYTTCLEAMRRGVVIGAHPGYADREGFGRRIIPMSHGELGRMVVAQIGALAGIATLAGTEVRYVKLHGELANLAAADAGVADAVIAAVQSAFPSLALLAISGTQIELRARAAGVQVFSEVFADRAYQPNGQLLPRRVPGAVIHDVDQAVDRLLRFAESGRMDVAGGGSIELDANSICVHGDTPGAVGMAAEVRARLTAAGFTPRPFLNL